MNLVLDERIKHRLIGLAVIISLVAIFAPAIMKKSSQHFDQEIRMHVQSPPKPPLPEVAVSNKEKLFKTIKVAHVKLTDPLTKNESIHLAQKGIEKKIPLETLAKNFVTPVPKFTKSQPVEIAIVQSSKTAVVIKDEPKITAKSKKLAPVIIKKPVSVTLNREIYSVQLASFSQQKNAQELINRLHSKGFVGKIVKSSSKNGNQFKVYVGKSSQKEQALKLKNQLAVALQLNGFIVSGVG